MERFNRWAGLVLAAVFLSQIPGTAAYAAAAAELSLPGPQAASAWGSAVPGIAIGLSLQSLTPQYEQLGRVMSEARLEQALSPKDRSGLLFLNYLPADQSTPEELHRLTPDQQADVLAGAVARAAKDVSQQADELLAKDAGGEALSEADRRELRQLGSGSWIYLDSDRASRIRTMAARFEAKKALELAGATAKVMHGLGLQPLDPVAAAEVQYLFAGVSRLNDVRSRKGQAVGDEHVQAKLAPYVARALDQAGDRLEARGIPRWKLSAMIVSRHREVFGVLAHRKPNRKLVGSMRKTGEWTPFVAALSLAAAERLEASSAPEALEALRTGGAMHDLSLSIPSWHPLAGRFRTVAEALAVYGSRAEAIPGRGLRLGRLFGAPFVVRPGALVMIGLSAFEGGSLSHILPGFGFWVYPLLSVGLTALFYGSVLAHELGHSIVSRLFGIKTRYVTLSFFGGGAALANDARRAIPDGSIAFAGPFVNFLLSALTFVPLLLGVHAPAAILGLRVLFAANLLLGASNLIPMYPLDGGRIMKAFFSLILRDDYRAARASYYVTLALSVLGTAAAAWLGLGHHWALAAAALVTSGIGFIGRGAAAHPGTKLAEKKPAA